MKNKRCNACGKYKKIDEFYRDRSCNDGHSYTCKKCQDGRTKSSPNRRIIIKEYRKRYYRKPEHRPLIWIQQNKSRDIRSGIEFSLTLNDVKKMFDNGCKYCGETDIFLMTIDRIDNKGGHAVDNTVSCCTRCQFIRRDMPMVAFEYLVPFIRKAKLLGLFGDWTGKPQQPMQV